MSTSGSIGMGGGFAPPFPLHVRFVKTMILMLLLLIVMASSAYAAERLRSKPLAFLSIVCMALIVSGADGMVN